MQNAERAERATARHRILIVDDHPLMRAALREMLEQEEDFEVCGEADDVAGALSRLETVRPDVAIVDLSLRGCEGFALLKALKGHHCPVRAVVLSLHDDPAVIERALADGASCYINKAAPPEEIVAAVRGGDAP